MNETPIEVHEFVGSGFVSRPTCKICGNTEDSSIHNTLVTTINHPVRESVCIHCGDDIYVVYTPIDDLWVHYTTTVVWCDEYLQETMAEPKERD